MPATTPLEVPQQGSEFYTWSFPGAPVQVQLHLKVVQGIRQCLPQASLPGASVSGVLLGKIVAPGLPEITGFKTLPTGNPAELGETIAFFRNSDDNLLPVGYFRTHPDDRLSLSPEDLSLAETYFSDPNCVFLLIEASVAGAANAGFFFWDRGKMNGGFYDFCFLEFPFDLPLLTTDGQLNTKTDPPPPPDLAPIEPLFPTRRQPVRLVERLLKTQDADPSLGSVTPHSEAKSGSVESHKIAADLPPRRSGTPLPEIDSTQVGQPASVQETQDNPISTPEPPRFSRAIRLTVTLVLLGLASLAVGMFLPQRLAWISGRGKNTESTQVALKVERQGTDLSVTWNHNSPLVSHAEAGRLTIYDGGAHEFPLDKNDIRSGSVVYSPVTAQIRVQLDLQTNKGITSESVMILNPLGTTDSLPPVALQSWRPVPSAPRDTGARELPNASRASTSVRATRDFLPPQVRAAAQPQSPELALPPPVTAMNSAPTAFLAPGPALPHSPPPPPVPKAISTAKTSPPVASQPSERPPDIVPPVAIQQTVPPPLTPAQRSFISRTVLVDIKVCNSSVGLDKLMAIGYRMVDECKRPMNPSSNAVRQAP